MLRKFAAAILSALLLSTGWLGMTGLTLLVAFVPLLWLSAERDGSRRAWWGMFGWALLTFVLWNAMTVWWIWNATPVGPIAATLASTFLNMLAFMAFHTVSKRAPKALAYTLLVAGWLTTEYWYTTGEFSWPWLILGNGFSHDIRLVQWYEYTGVFGGSLWVLLVNILLFETLRSPSRRRALTTAAAVLLPMLLSLGLYAGYEEPEARARVTLVQPNVDCYDKFAAGTERLQMENLLELAGEAPADADYILLPETAVPGYWWESSLRASDPVQRFAALLRERQSGAMLITGANTLRHYPAGTQSETARPYEGGGYIDIYNTALGIDSTGGVQLHHKGRLVIGVENTPTWVFDVLKFLVIDLGARWGKSASDGRAPSSNTTACGRPPPSATRGSTVTSAASLSATEPGRSSSSRTTAGGATRPATATCSPSRDCAPSSTAAPWPARPTPACRASSRRGATSGGPSAGRSAERSPTRWPSTTASPSTPATATTSPASPNTWRCSACSTTSPTASANATTS